LDQRNLVYLLNIRRNRSEFVTKMVDFLKYLNQKREYYSAGLPFWYP
jgi:hypothetical protein